MENLQRSRDPVGKSSADIRLRDYNNYRFDRGRSVLREVLWLFTSAIFVSSGIVGSTHRCFILRAFGARIGKRVSIKPGVRIKFPWRLQIGDDSWVGEDVWIDNLATVQIGANCCVSQGAYICAGSHDWSATTFDLITKPVRIEDGVWIAARATVGPGLVVGEGAILTLGSVATKNLTPWGIYQGNPATLLKKRRVRSPNLKSCEE